MTQEQDPSGDSSDPVARAQRDGWRGRGVLVVSDSPVNRIVLARTAARVGLIARETDFPGLLTALNDGLPRILIADLAGVNADVELFGRVTARFADEPDFDSIAILRAEDQAPGNPELAVSEVIRQPVAPEVLETVLLRLTRD